MSIGICFGSSKYDSDSIGAFSTIYEQSKTIRHYDELETQIRQLTGYNLETLKQLFAAGYTLTPPDYSSSPSMSEMAEKGELP